MTLVGAFIPMLKDNFMWDKTTILLLIFMILFAMFTLSFGISAFVSRENIIKRSKPIDNSSIMFNVSVAKLYFQFGNKEISRKDIFEELKSSGWNNPDMFLAALVERNLIKIVNKKEGVFVKLLFNKLKNRPLSYPIKKEESIARPQT
jgi:hypothetical protein